MKKTLTALLVGTIISASALNVSANTKFKDVPSTYYAKDAITQLVDKGVIKGYADGTFRPANKVNRAEFAAFVARALNLPAASSNFKDVPKSAALYDGVSRAYKAGIIKGFADGKFKPSTSVTRQDMAVMLDRAMQVKGSYTKTKSLNFSDASKIGPYARTSVQRVYNYGVMGAYSGTKFEPITIGTRAETAKHIFNMLQVVDGGSPSQPSENKDYRSMSLAELKAAYPQHNHVFVQRLWKPEAKIVVEDMLEMYYKELHDPVIGKYAKSPDEWFAFMLPGFISSAAGNYIDYPMREVIAYNGNSYKDSPFMATDFNITERAVYNTMPFQPNEKGQFLIDIHRYDNDFVIYRHEDVKWDVLAENPTVVESDYVVDLYKTFQYATGVTMAKGGLEIAYNGQKIILSNGSKNAIINGKTVVLSQSVNLKSGRAYGPVREIAEHIGLYTKELPEFKRIEITNFSR
ncbi:S-layer homology domain-containing protein [Bacillus sp. NRRL B-14911]|uniref:S-layer homology domain-containing protein n=1 Tax=Bacillus sp. NRRL B-14911 TaxID=313627 RepID=UPI00054DF484|nr:S-layer homology domain-containing protein [Bacillus sp. NRRL B-14911]